MTSGPGLTADHILFPLARSSTVIGRTDRSTGIYPDIDLSPLGGGLVVSRRHAEIRRHEDGFFLRDLGSRAGTFVNGEQLGAADRKLQEGDAVTIGPITLRFSERCAWPKGLTAEWSREQTTLSSATQPPLGLPLIAQLPAALNAGELLLHYQPQVSLSSGAIDSVEALIRWNHPKMGMVAPNRYLSLAEDSGFVRVLTLFALKEAANCIREWRRDGVPVAVGVNLSVTDLGDITFGDRVAEVVDSSGTEPGDFVLEMTESAVMLDPGVAVATLENLRSLGFLIAIDDFGTGHSSLAYLKDLPAHEVKLDKSFFIGMSPRDEAIVVSAVQMAHDLGIEAVAEGVEDEDVARFLIGIGCDKAQGYYFGEPVPKAALDLRGRSLPA
jgi:EAL domain-containing protein (putative c-di-GMP-specific phosphodiesterase class I)